MTHKFPEQQRRAIFPGSFNPFTRGHQSLVDRALSLFDHIVIAIGISTEKGPSDASARIEPIKKVYEGNDRVSVITYDGLTVDAAKENGCNAIVRGIRNSIDLEYERPMADANRMLSGIETVFLFTLPEYSMISSSLVRELQRYGKDASEMMPDITGGRIQSNN